MLTVTRTNMATATTIITARGLKVLVSLLCPGMVLLSFIFSVGAVLAACADCPSARIR